MKRSRIWICSVVLACAAGCGGGGLAEAPKNPGPLPQNPMGDMEKRPKKGAMKPAGGLPPMPPMSPRPKGG